MSLTRRHSRRRRQYEYMEYKYRPGQSIGECLSGWNVVVTRLKSLGKNLDDADVISKILHDLPREYDNFKVNWRLIASENEDMLRKDKFFSHLMTVESSMEKERKQTEAFLAQRPSSGGSYMQRSASSGTHRQTETRTCFKCGTKGHIAGKCRKAAHTCSSFNREASSLLKVQGTAASRIQDYSISA